MKKASKKQKKTAPGARASTQKKKSPVKKRNGPSETKTPQVASKRKAKPATARKKKSAKKTALRVVAKAVPPRASERAPLVPTEATAAGVSERPASVPLERRVWPAGVSEGPRERSLTDEEREAMSKVAATALAALDSGTIAARVVARIAAFVDEIRCGLRSEPTSQDIRLGLGVLWGEEVRAHVGWRWVHLSYADGFASYALVPEDRAYACFPLNRLSDLMKNGAQGVNPAVPLFDSIRLGALPASGDNTYLVIG